MAKKRMFNNEIVSSDKFLDMAISTQCLYFHLCMNADDDGFVSPKRIMRMIGSTDDELRVLAMKGFVLAFNDGVIVITHWKLNNNEIKLDRYNKTIYQEHLKTLSQYNKVYALELVGVQNVGQMEDQSRVDKSRIEKKITPETELVIENVFETFRDLYDKKIDRDKCYKKWIKLSEGERAAAIKHIPQYKISQPDKQFRKNPETYINNKSWNNEIITGGLDYTDINNFHDMMMQDRVPELKNILGLDKYFEVKKQRKDSPLYLSF